MVVGKIPIVIFIGSASQPIETTLALKLSSFFFLTPLLYQFGFSTVDVFCCIMLSPHLNNCHCIIHTNQFSEYIFR